MAVKTDRLVTLFGGGGFVGRYVAQALLGAGARIRIAQRRPKSAYFIRPLGGLGQVQFVRADVTDADSVAAAVAGSDAVINLAGTLKGPFEPVHVAGAANVARAAAAAGAGALVQISAIGADADSASAYARTKAEGEAAARAAFAGATIVRPSIVFGPEDDFVNRFARLARLAPAIPVVRAGWRLQPVHCTDLGHAVARAALDPAAHAGATFELGGPRVMTMREVQAWIARSIGHGGKPLFDVPDALAGLGARLFGWLPGAPLSWQQWLMLQQDNVARGADFAAFGIRPSPLAAIADEWLTIYRRRGRFAPPRAY
jgi:NADH dehydrogenase